MDTLEEYRDADYDIDIHFDRTTSWPEGLQETFQFEPNLTRPVRRTNSADDVQRYKDHFSIAKKNQGEWFKWKHYLKILEDDLRHFDTLVIMTKSLLHRLASPRESEISHYITASEGDITVNRPSSCKIVKRLPSVQIERTCDTDSVCSMATSINSASSATGLSINSNVSLSPHKMLLKKFCTGIRNLASKTYKTVEKMSQKTKYCSACGDYIGSMKIHKKCSQSTLNLVREMEPGMLRNSSLPRHFSLSMNSVTSFGSGESTVKPSFTGNLAMPQNRRGFTKRMLPFLR